MIGAALGFLTGSSAARAATTLAAGMAIGCWGGWQIAQGVHARADLQQQRTALKAIEAAQAETTRLQEVKDAAITQANQTAQANRRAADGARTELERLRSAQRTRASAATTCAATADRADTLDQLLSACSSALTELGRAADAHAADALMLYSAWPRESDGFDSGCKIKPASDWSAWFPAGW